MNARQIDLFDPNRTVDTRTKRQRKRAKIANGPTQVEMFSQREMGQFGVTARPKIDIRPKTRIELLSQDLRSKEEIERAEKERIESLNYSLF
jgi:hypothetical protein